MALIDQLAQAIAQMEGFNVAGSVAQRNDNPGNLTASPYATGNVNGYSVFPDVQTGWDALYYQLNLYSQRGLTLEQMADIYAPAGNTAMTQGNDPNAYLNYLTSQLGVGPSTSISALYDNTDTDTTSASSVSTDVSQDDTDATGQTDVTDILSGIFGSDGGDGTDGGGISGGLAIGFGLVGLAVLVMLMNR